VLIHDAEIEQGGERVRADVLLQGGRIERIGSDLGDAAGGPRFEARGAALLPALHDHHIHLRALAAALRSVACGPPAVRTRDALARALRTAGAGAGGWVRGVGYHESVAGVLDRDTLDRLAPGRRVRVQHRSGAAWLLSSAALEAVGIASAVADLPEGVERDAAGRPTGRLFRLDDWLRERLPAEPAPGLAEPSRLLAAAGVASVTDATPSNDAATLDWLEREREAGALRQKVVLMGGDGLGEIGDGPFARGPEKLVLDERALPPPEVLAARIETAHRSGRPVAIHCVTRVELVMAAHALETAGALPADRIEHASLAPPELVAWLALLGVCVVTQPGFVYERGDHYLRDVAASERPWLYRCRGFDEARVPLGAGTDAPYAEPDPWRAMQAAVDRRTALGAELGSDEAVSPERALALFTTPHDAPGGSPRRLTVGAAADLVLLDRPWRAARDRLAREDVAATFGSGRVLWRRGRS
jgi:predicted amidohydrolase YtcJ